MRRLAFANRAFLFGCASKMDGINEKAELITRLSIEKVEFNEKMIKVNVRCL